MKKDKMATTKMIFVVIFTVVWMEGSSGRVIKKDKKGFGEVCGGLENKYGVCEHGFECDRETIYKKGTCGMNINLSYFFSLFI